MHGTLYYTIIIFVIIIKPNLFQEATDILDEYIPTEIIDDQGNDKQRDSFDVSMPLTEILNIRSQEHLSLL